MATLTSHDALEKIVSHADRGRRGDIGRAMLDRARHALLRSAPTCGLKLAPEQDEFFLVSDGRARLAELRIEVDAVDGLTSP